MFNRWARPASTSCEHSHRMTVRASGIERAVCELCGHVRFRAVEGMSGTVERSQFRRASQPSDRVTVG